MRLGLLCALLLLLLPGCGVQVDSEGVRGPGFTISGEGIRLPGVTLSREGAAVAGRPLPRPHLALRWAGLCLLGAATLALLPEHVARMAAALGSRPGQVAAEGLLFLLVLVVVSFPLLLTLVISVVGIALLPLIGLALAGLKFLGYVAVATFLGGRLGLTGRYAPFIAGSVLLALAALLPVLRTAAGIAGAVLGLGAVISTRLGRVSPR